MKRAPFLLGVASVGRTQFLGEALSSLITSEERHGSASSAVVRTGNSREAAARGLCSKPKRGRVLMTWPLGSAGASYHERVMVMG